MSWTAPAFMDELKARLEDWGPLSDVNIATAPNPKLQQGDYIVFLRAPGEQEWAAIGNRSKAEDYTVEGQAFIERQGTDEAQAVEARNAARDLVDELENCLRDMVSPDNISDIREAIGAREITNVNLVDASLDAQGFIDGKRWCGVTFGINVQTRI